MTISHLTLPTPEQSAATLWKRIPKETRLTFFSAVILGFLAHMYMFTNKLPNHDDINHLFSCHYGTASGRWLLPAVLQMDGSFSMPWLIGTLSLLCLGATACLTVSLFRIRRPLGCIITAGLIVSFPAVTATFTYMFTADAYFLSLLLAAFGAYAAVRLRFGVLLGAAAITLSMGLYQSYFSVAAVLMVGALLFETLDGERTFPQLFFRGLRLVGTLAAGMAAYLIVVRITSLVVPLGDYMGISSMGHLSLRELPVMIKNCYVKYLTFFLRDDTGSHFGLLKYAFAAAALCTVLLGVRLLYERRLGATRTLLAVALAAVFPLAGDLVFIMASGAYIHDLMTYGLVFTLILPLALADYMEPAPHSSSMQPLRAAASWVILLTMALTAYSYTLTANAAYLKIDLSFRQCSAYSNRMLDKIESCPGYRSGMPIVLLGHSTLDSSPSISQPLDAINLTGVFDFGDFRTSYTYAYFLHHYLGITGVISVNGSQAAQPFLEMDQVKSMPLYPEAGSIQIIDDTVVVKLNDF